MHILHVPAHASSIHEPRGSAILDDTYLGMYSTGSRYSTWAQPFHPIQCPCRCPGQLQRCACSRSRRQHPRTQAIPKQAAIRHDEAIRTAFALATFPLPSLAGLAGSVTCCSRYASSRCSPDNRRLILQAADGLDHHDFRRPRILSAAVAYRDPTSPSPLRSGVFRLRRYGGTEVRSLA